MGIHQMIHFKFSTIIVAAISLQLLSCDLTDEDNSTDCRDEDEFKALIEMAEILDLEVTMLNDTEPERIENLLFYCDNSHQIYKINLKDITVKNLPEQITRFSNLNSLDIFRTELEYLPDNFKNLANLDTLYFTHSNLKEIPSDIGKLTKLTYLHLHSNNLTSIPKEIETLKNLEVFSVSENNIDSFSVNFEELVKLEALSLRDNNIRYLPKSIGSISNLKRLNIEDNLIIELPNEIKNLNLTSFNYNNNNICSSSVDSEVMADISN